MDEDADELYRDQHGAPITEDLLRSARKIRSAPIDAILTLTLSHIPSRAHPLFSRIHESPVPGGQVGEHPDKSPREHKQSKRAAQPSYKALPLTQEVCKG